MNIPYSHQVQMEEMRLSPEPGTDLFCRIWEPAGDSCEQDELPKTLFLVHGACEYGERYDRFVMNAIGNGWRVIAPDLRGHGHSTGDYVHVFRFDEYVNDLRFLTKKLECRAERTVLVGCSMGGLISIRYVQQQAVRHEEPCCCSLVLLSPLLGLKLPVPYWKILAGRLLSRFLPKTRFRSTIDPNMLTHDAEAIRIRKLDHLIRQQVSARWFMESAQAIRTAFAEVDRYTTPTLILQSGADHVVDPLATRAWVEQVNRCQVNQCQRSIPVCLEFLPGWYHEVLREIYWHEAAKCILDFAEDRLSGSSLNHPSLSDRKSRV